MLTRIFADVAHNVARLHRCLGLPGRLERIHTLRNLIQFHDLGGMHIMIGDLLAVLLGCNYVDVDLGDTGWDKRRGLHDHWDFHYVLVDGECHYLHRE